MTLANGSEERNQRWAHARRRHNAGYGVKSRADMQAVLAFFEERRGRFHSFLWRDALDYSSGGDPPAPDDQTLGVGDGVTATFQLVKRYGVDFDPYIRPITKPVAGSVRVTVAGAELEPGAFAVEATTGLVTLVAAPDAGAAVTAGFLFDVPVRFDTDRLDIEWTSFDAADVPAIPLIEVLE